MMRSKVVQKDAPAQAVAAPELVLPSGAPKAVGRKRDESRDGAILEAAVDILSEVGYREMTMEMVAARAKAGKGTVYRRWPSKAEMVIDAVSQMKRSLVDLDHLPDTGSLRGDLLALFRPQSVEDTGRNLRVMAGLASMLSQHPSLAEAVHAAVVTPWVDANRILLRRACERGEASKEVDIETLAQVIPSVAAYRALIQRRPFERAFLVKMLDGVLLPALGIV